MVFYLLIAVLVLETAMVLAGIFIFGSLLLSLSWGSPYMGIPRNNIRSILSFGGLAPEDIFYDLGAGDGRVIIAAKEEFTVKKAVGLELSPWPYVKARTTIYLRGLADSIQFERKNILYTNLAEATFVYLYLYTSFINEKVAPKLAQE